MTDDILVGVVVEESGLTIEQLATACGVEREWVLKHVEGGCFPGIAGAAGEWRFTAAAVRRARRMRGLERDFDAVPELAALVADLLDEMDRLRAQVHGSAP